MRQVTVIWENDMTCRWNRREVLHASLSGGLFLGVQCWEGSYPRLTAAHLAASGRSEDQRIERLAERIMETSPGRIVDVVMTELRNGLSRQQLLAATYNAGARFHNGHSAYVAHPVRAVSDDVAAGAGLLPLFYHLSVLRFRAGRSRLPQLDLSKLPATNKAELFFHDAMKEGNGEDAALAIIALAREYGPRQAYANLWMYGAERNHRSGGHTAISISNTWRTMEATDWRCAETALRFAVNDANVVPTGSDVHAVNRERAARVGELPPQWSSIRSDRGATLELLDSYRRGDPSAACDTTFSLLRGNGVQAGSVWDAVFLTTAELVIRYTWFGTRMLAGHSVTCVNALHYAFRTLSDPVVRLYATLEAVEWTTSFLARERDRPALRGRSILDIAPADLRPDDEALEEIFSLLPPRRFASDTRVGFEDVDRAVEITYAWAKGRSNFRPFMQAAQRLMCVKSTPEAHDFKFPIALFENCRYASPEWRPHLLAATVHVLQGSDMEDSQIVAQAREALSG